jgi:hypothetical protein
MQILYTEIRTALLSRQSNWLLASSERFCYGMGRDSLPNVDWLWSLPRWASRKSRPNVVTERNRMDMPYTGIGLCEAITQELLGSWTSYKKEKQAPRLLVRHRTIPTDVRRCCWISVPTCVAWSARRFPRPLSSSFILSRLNGLRSRPTASQKIW